MVVVVLLAVQVLHVKNKTVVWLALCGVKCCNEVYYVRMHMELQLIFHNRAL